MKDLFSPGVTWLASFPILESRAMNRLLVLTIFAGTVTICSGAELVFVPGKISPIDDTYCIYKGINPFDEDPDRRTEILELNVYDQLIQCSGDETCLGLVVNEFGDYGLGHTEAAEDKSGEYVSYKKLGSGSECPEGTTPYVHPRDVFSKYFCKYTNQYCWTLEKIGEPIKKNMDFEKCLEKCKKNPECSAVNYLEESSSTKRCELLQGHCRPGLEINHFYGMTTYVRLENYRAAADAECPDVGEPYCAEGDEEVLSETYTEAGGNPTAHCPDDHVITRCECAPGFFGGLCVGMRINEDMKSCTAERKTKMQYMRARVCCRPLTDGMETTHFTTDNDVYSYTCPDNSEAICAQFGSSRHNNPVSPSEGLSLTNKWDRRKCKATSSPDYGKLSVICLKTPGVEIVPQSEPEKLPDQTSEDRVCEADDETEIIGPSGSTVTCGEDEYVSLCDTMRTFNDGSTEFWNGMSWTTRDARSCTGRFKEGFETRACCKKLENKKDVIAVSDPVRNFEEVLTGRYASYAYRRHVYIACPEKTTLVTCVAGDMYGIAGGHFPQPEGNACKFDSRGEVGITAICEGGEKWIEKVRGE